MKCTVFIFRLFSFYQHLTQVTIRKKWKTKYSPIFPMMFSFHTIVFTFEHWLEKKNNHREVKKWNNIHEFGCPGFNSVMHLNHPQRSVIIEWEVTYLRFCISLSSAKPWHFVLLTRSEVMLMMLIHGPHFKKHWSRGDIPDLFGKPLHKLST